MRRDEVDFFAIPEKQMGIHKRLLNWRLWVKPGFPTNIHPMFRQARSNARQWHVPEIRETCDTLDAHYIEKAMRFLPEKHRLSLKWYYIECDGPWAAQRRIGITRTGLLQLVSDARQMLINRID